jgi:hypothetical protein
LHYILGSHSQYESTYLDFILFFFLFYSFHPFYQHHLKIIYNLWGQFFLIFRALMHDRERTSEWDRVNNKMSSITMRALVSHSLFCYYKHSVLRCAHTSTNAQVLLPIISLLLSFDDCQTKSPLLLSLSLSLCIYKE